MNISFNGTMSLLEASDADETNFVQTYRVNGRHDADITALLQGDASVNYMRQMQSNGYTADVISPGGGLQLVNEFFSADLTAVHNKSSNSQTASSTSTQWQFNAASIWTSRFWPRVATYAERQSNEAGSGAGESIASKFGSSINWDLEYLELNYSFNQDVNETTTAGSEDIAVNHFAALRSARSFWKNRINASVDLQYTQADREFSTITDASGFGLVPFTAQLWGGTDVDGSAVINDLADSFPLLIDLPPAGTKALVIRGDFRDSNMLYVYTVEDQSVNISALQWDVYVSLDGSQAQSWSLHAAQVASFYNSGLKRFEIPVNSVRGYDVKLLVSQIGPVITPPGQINIQRVDLYRYIQGSAGVASETSESTRSRANLNLSINPVKDVTAFYLFSYDTEDDSTRQRTHLFQSATVSWSISRLTRGAVSVSNDNDDDPSAGDTQIRNYSATLQTQPLPAVRVSTTISRNERYENSQPITTGHSASVSGTAQLFQDLDSQFALRYSTSEKNVTAMSPGSKAENISGDLRFTGRFTPKLTCDLVETYSAALGGTGAQTLSSSLKGTWRLSDYLTLYSSLNRSSASDSDATLDYSFSASWLVTSKIKTNMNYLLSMQEITSQRVSMDWSYNLSRLITVSTNGVYMMGDDADTWSVGLSLLFRYRGY